MMSVLVYSQDRLTDDRIRQELKKTLATLILVDADFRLIRF